MTVDGSNLEASFRAYDGPDQLPHGLEQRILAAAMQPAVPGPQSGRQHSLFWLNAVAAAALVLFVAATVLIAVMRSNAGSTTPDPTFVAAVAMTTPAANQLQPVMAGGSAAQDNAYPGAIPVNTTFQRLWTADLTGYGTFAFFGNTLFVQSGPDSRTDPVQLTAFDAATGRLLWQQPISRAIGFAVDQRGVYVGVALTGYDREPGFVVTLLDAATGGIVWQNTDPFPLVQTSSPELGVLIDGDHLIFMPDTRTVVALNTANGGVVWRHSSTASVWSACPTQDCVTMPATADGALYWVDYASNSILALDPATGNQQWSTTFLTPEEVALLATQSTFVFATVSAVTGGVLVEHEVHGPTTQLGAVVQLLDRTTGSERWRTTGTAPGWPIPMADGLIYVAKLNSGDDSSNTIVAIDIATGAAQATYQFDSVNPIINSIYLPEANLVLGGLRSAIEHKTALQKLPVVGHYFGHGTVKATLTWLDPQTLQPVGTAVFKNCHVAEAVSYDGKVVCIDDRKPGFSVYAPDSE